MPPLLPLVHTILEDLADQATIERVHSRAADHRRELGTAGGTVPRVEAVLQAFSEVTNVSLPDAYRIFGRRAITPLREQLARELKLHSTAHTLCLNLNAVVRAELQPLLPAVPFPVVDVEMVDANSLRVSIMASPEIMALVQGMISGVAQELGQIARFSEVPASGVRTSALQSGRCYVDVVFQRDERSGGGADRRSAAGGR